MVLIAAGAAIVGASSLLEGSGVTGGMQGMFGAAAGSGGRVSAGWKVAAWDVLTRPGDVLLVSHQGSETCIQTRQCFLFNLYFSLQFKLRGFEGPF